MGDENRCEFEKYCMTEENTICASAENYLECDEYGTLCLVFNHTIEKALRALRGSHTHANAHTRIKALKKNPPSQEGE